MCLLFRMQLLVSGNKPLCACARETFALQSLNLPRCREAPVPNLSERRRNKLQKQLPVLENVCLAELYPHAPEGRTRCSVGRLQSVPNVAFCMEKKLDAN